MNIDMSHEKNMVQDGREARRHYSAYFEYQQDAPGADRKRDFRWWERVMERQMERIDTFRLECLPRDAEGLASCARLGAGGLARVRTEGTRELWTGRAVEAFRKEFLYDPFDKKGAIKWNAALLKGRGRTVLASSSNGMRIGIHGVEEQDLLFYTDLIEGRHFSFYYWEDAGNGQVVSFQSIYAFAGDIVDIIQAYQQGKR